MAAPASEGGAGGKFRKKPFGRLHTTTPYDRPQTALRAAAAAAAGGGGGGGGWISKVVDPASKLITSGAHRLFASMFRKRLTAPPSPPLPPQDKNQESRNKGLETVATVPLGAQELAIVEGSNAGNKSDGSSIAEIEQVLKQNTFTRSEIERLMGLLHARTLDSSAVDTVERPQANYSELVTVQDKPETIADMPVLENGSENHRIAGVTSTPIVSSRVLEEDIASPADLAKAYMGHRPSKASPSMFGFRTQAFKEDATLLRNTTFSQKSAMLPVPRSSIHIGVPDNGFMTPRSRGRSAIYNMARTPYSRALPVTAHKGPRLTIDGHGVPSSSSSQRIFEQNGFSESRKSVLKRKSSVLGDDVGFGPIRRIRQKSKILSASSTSPFSGTPISAKRAAIVGSNAEQLYLPSAQMPLSLDEPKQNVSKKLLGDEDSSSPATSFTPVPPQSRKTAEKIFQHLDNLVSPSKEKSTEAKLAAIRDTSPAKLTTDMLHGRALRSLENLDTSKFLQSVHVDSKLESSSQKQDKVEGNGSINFFPSERVAPATRDSDATLSINDKVPVKNSHPAIKNAVGSSPQNSRAFQMSAHEDNLDFDDENTGQDGPVQGEVLNISVAEGKGSAVAAVGVEEAPVLTEFKPSADSVLTKSTDSRTLVSPVVAEKVINSNFSTTIAPGTTAQPTLLLHSDVSPKATNTDPLLCNFGSEKVNGVPALQFSSSSSVSKSPTFNFAASLTSKPEINSFSNVVTEAVQKNPEPERGDGKSKQKVWESVSKPDGAPSCLASSSSSPSPALSTTLPSPTGLFSFATSANNSSLNNGSISSSPMFSSSASAADGNNCTKSISSNISPVCASTGGSTTATSSTAAPPFSLVTKPPPALIGFGGTLSASDSPIPVTSGGHTTGMDTKAAQEKTATGMDAKETQEKSTTGADAKAVQEKTTTGMDPYSAQEKTTINFGVTSAISSGGSSLFSFSSSAPSATATNQPQGTFPFGSGSGSGIGSVGIIQAPSSGTDLSSFTQSIPCQLGSSGSSSPVFGATTFSSSSSPFCSSSTASNVFGSGTNLASSSSAPAPSPNSTSSTSATTTSTSVFGSTWQSSKTPIFSSTSKSTVPSPGFSFGLSQVPPSSGSTPTSFGSSTGASTLSSMFSFTSASAVTPSFPSSSPLQPVFGNPNLSFASGATAPGNNDQMSLEDSMAEDNVQASSAFLSNVQSSPTPTPGFMFNSPAPSGPPSFQFGGQQQNPTTPANSPFQFGGQQQNQTGPANSPFQFGGQQQNQTPPANSLFQFGGHQQNQTAAPANSPFQFGGRQNQPASANSPFEASGSLDFNAGGSFSLGSSTGADKSSRRIIKVKHKQQRKK